MAKNNTDSVLNENEVNGSVQDFKNKNKSKKKGNNKGTNGVESNVGPNSDNLFDKT